MKPSPILLGGLAILLLGGGAGAYYWHRSEQRAAIFAAAIPAQPDLSHWPQPMRDRVAAAERRLATEPVGALAELGQLYHANGFFTEAVQCYAGLEQLDPKNARWPHLHATILAGYGDTGPALPLWQRAVAVAPDYVPAKLRLGDVYLRRDDLASAARIYHEILADHPDESYATLGLARCEFEAEHWQKARELLEPLVARTSFVLGYDLITTVYERLGMEDQARAIRARERASGAYRDPVDPWVDDLAEDCYDVYRLSLASGAAQRNGDISTAFRRIEQALALAPDQATLHFQLGGLNRQTKAYSKARECFEKTTRLQPDFSDGWAQLGAICLLVGDRTAADHAVLEGLRHCPNSPGLHLQNATRLERDGRSEESIAEFRESIRLRPNEADAYLGLAKLLINLKREEEALTAVDQALVAEPDNPLALSIHAFAAIVAGDEAAARRWTHRAENQPRVERVDLDRMRAAYRTKFGHDLR